MYCLIDEKVLLHILVMTIKNSFSQTIQCKGYVEYLHFIDSVI